MKITDLERDIVDFVVQLYEIHDKVFIKEFGKNELIKYLKRLIKNSSGRKKIISVLWSFYRKTKILADREGIKNVIDLIPVLDLKN